MKEGTKRILRMAGFREQIDAVEHGCCPFCKQPVSIDEFRDEKSKKEYQISGMCQRCQDGLFQGGGI
jgi:hypothetical protein